MNRYYHITKRENVKNILKDGLIPDIGDRSQYVGESEKRVYLCDKNSLPYWVEVMKSFMDEYSVLSVDTEEKPVVFEYAYGNEYIFENPISNNGIKLYRYQRNKHLSEIRNIHISCISDLSYAITNICRYGMSGDESDFDHEERAKYELKNVMALVRFLDYNKAFPKEQFSSGRDSMIRQELSYLGENGVFTFLDESDVCGVKCYNRILDIKGKEHKDAVIINKFIKKNFRPYLRFRAGILGYLYPR